MTWLQKKTKNMVEQWQREKSEVGQEKNEVFVDEVWGCPDEIEGRSTYIFLEFEDQMRACKKDARRKAGWISNER